MAACPCWPFTACSARILTMFSTPASPFFLLVLWTAAADARISAEVDHGTGEVAGHGASASSMKLRPLEVVRISPMTTWRQRARKVFGRKAIDRRTGNPDEGAISMAVAGLIEARQSARAEETALDTRASALIVAAGIVIAANISADATASKLAGSIALYTAALSALAAVASMVVGRRVNLDESPALRTLSAPRSSAEQQMLRLDGLAQELEDARQRVVRRERILLLGFALVAISFVALAATLIFDLYDSLPK